MLTAPISRSDRGRRFVDGRRPSWVIIAKTHLLVRCRVVVSSEASWYAVRPPSFSNSRRKTASPPPLFPLILAPFSLFSANPSLLLIRWNSEVTRLARFNDFVRKGRPSEQVNGKSCYDVSVRSEAWHFG